MSPEGILNIDKPLGITSHDAVSRVRKLSGIRRVGHAGTLDPLATGVLILFVGRATRLVEYMVGSSKRYEATIRLGQVTNTYDAEGEIIEERPVHLAQEDIAAALPAFRGQIQQRAPIYSAIKKDGQPLYKLARRGEAVEAPVRQVQIYELALLSYQAPEVHLAVHCSSGTYIRSLAFDLGESLGTGGHLSALRRSAVGDFSIKQAVRLDELDQENLPAYLQPSDTAVRHLPRVDFTAEDMGRLQLGQQVPRDEKWLVEDIARAYGADDLFAGIVRVRGTMWQPHKMFLPTT